MAGVLRQPDPSIVTEKKAAAVLRHLGLEWAAEPGFVPRPLPPIVPLSPRNPRDWWVGEEAMVTFHGTPEEFPTGGRWTCDRDPRSEGRCWEVAAAILVHCWNRPDLRPLFDVPSWSLDLLDLMRPTAEEEAPERRRGWIRYTLLPDDDHPGVLPVRRHLIRLSRRDGQPLKPRMMPADLSEVEQQIEGLRPADRLFHDVHEALRALERPPLTAAPDQVEEARARLRARAFALLLEVDDLWHGEAPIGGGPPHLPVLEARDHPDGGIALRWRTPIRASWRAGPGYVLTDDTLRPLAPTHLAREPSLLTAPLPVVPAGDAADFVERFVLQSGVAMDLDSAHLPPTVEPARIEGRLLLDEVDGALALDARIAYCADGDPPELPVEPADPAPQKVMGEALLRRDREAEARLMAEAEAALGHGLPARLTDDAALGVLLDGLPRLPATWRVEGSDALQTYRVAGRLAPRISVPSGIDWLDLKVQFAVGEQRIDAAEVLASWRAGRRFHRLPDGALARLPDQWLERHGAIGDEIEALRRAGGGRLQAHAAPLVAELLEQAEGDRDRWARIKARLDAVDAIPECEPPEGLHAQLRDYQKGGYRWLRWLRDLGLGGVLADDMGLGKTVQALALLLDTHAEPGQPSLVVAPTSVIYNWADEAARFTPSLKVHVHHGPQRPPLPPEDADLVITSYALLRADEVAFAGPWRVMILDEAQRIKNPRSNVARAARELDARHRFALTGTPLENHLLELWSIFECLMPGFFGTRAVFQRRYALPIERDRDEVALAALRARLKPFVLRRLKREVARELPPRQEQILYCELGDTQRRLYERVKATYREAVLRRVDAVGLARSTLPVLEALMRLRQACCDPGLLPFPEAREVGASAKLELLEETLEETIDAGHRTLVFSQWTSLLKRVAPRLDARGWPYLYLDGGTRNRHELVGRWNDPEGPPVFLVSLKAGGAGLNLVGADHVIHLDPWWNPAVEDQATDRAHRIGQTKPVVAYKLVARDTVEEKVLALQARKRALFDATVDQGRYRVDQLTREDLEAVLRAEDPEAAPLTALDDDFDLEGFEGFGEPLDLDPPPPPKPAAREAPVDDPIELIARGGRITNARIRKATGWSADRARAWLREQVRDGKLIKRGRKRGTYYEAPA